MPMLTVATAVYFMLPKNRISNQQRPHENQFAAEPTQKWYPIGLHHKGVSCIFMCLQYRAFAVPVL